MGRCSCELEVVFRSRVEHSYQFHSLPTNLAWQIFTKIFRYSVLLALNFPMPFLCPQAPLQNYIPVSGQNLSTDTCSHEMISSSCSSDASDSQFLSHELACELVFISLGILKFTSECRKINTSKKKDLTWESWSWGRKLFQRAGSSYSFSTKQYFIIPTLREWSSWCRAVRSVRCGQALPPVSVDFYQAWPPAAEVLREAKVWTGNANSQWNQVVSQLFGKINTVLRTLWLFSNGEEAKIRQGVPH